MFTEPKANNCFFGIVPQVFWNSTVNFVTLCYDCVDYSYQDIHIVLTGLFHSISKNFILTFVPLGKWKNEKWKL